MAGINREFAGEEYAEGGGCGEAAGQHCVFVGGRNGEDDVEGDGGVTREDVRTGDSELRNSW